MSDRLSSVEIPSRTLFVRNISYDAKEEDLKKLFEKYGEMKRFFCMTEKRGMAFVTYYDSRHADTAKLELQDSELCGRKISIHYSIPKEDGREDEKNKGTLFVVIKDANEPILNSKLRELFEQWAEIKDIRDCNEKARFVECYDLRDAEKILTERQDVSFAGGRLEIMYAKRSGPRSRTESTPSDRPSGGRIGGPIRSSFADRNHDRSGRGTPYGRSDVSLMDRGASSSNPLGSMAPLLIQNPAGGVNLLTLLAQNQLLNQSLGGIQSAPLIQSSRSAPIQQAPSAGLNSLQQLSYLLSLQQQLQSAQAMQPQVNNNSVIGNNWRRK